MKRKIKMCIFLGVIPLVIFILANYILIQYLSIDANGMLVMNLIFFFIYLWGIMAARVGA